ncbi:hypothetical protein TCON_1332 [Astathelohania contejeani]|uniref:Uncharacterized protein n=1 Tax=Astathelohania contejeani TaxID=164912 RepID=A0ABQ7HZ62_9MICR|nr:hypothetical protein TCON_1332 [Thelohania contejeani]
MVYEQLYIRKEKINTRMIIFKLLVYVILGVLLGCFLTISTYYIIDTYYHNHDYNNIITAYPNNTTETYPNNTTEAYLNNTTEAYPNNTTETYPNNTTEAYLNNTTEAYPNNTTETYLNNATETLGQWMNE